jgi:hypothetical protein
LDVRRRVTQQRIQDKHWQMRPNLRRSEDLEQHPEIKTLSPAQLSSQLTVADPALQS